MFFAKKLLPRSDNFYSKILKVLIQTIAWQRGKHVTQPLLLEQLIEFGIEISSGQLSRILTENKESFHQEKEAILLAGIEVSDYLQTDVRGKSFGTPKLLPRTLAHGIREKTVIALILAMNFLLGLKAQRVKVV